MNRARIHYLLCLALGYTPAQARQEWRDYLKAVRAAVKGKRLTIALAKRVTRAAA